jgi:FkbM family methyltransferase
MKAAEFVYSVLLRPRPLRAAANFLLRASVPRSVVRHGATIVLNQDDPIVSGALALGVYEPDETRFFLSACRPGMTFLDVGANCGYYTALFLTHAGCDNRVIALEPDPQCFEFLQHTVAANRGQNVSCVQVAASNAAGRVPLYRNLDNRGDNRLYANDLSTSLCEVETNTVDAILTGLGLQDLNLMKMDVQGYEGRVLEGMRETLRRVPDLTILSEFWPWGLRQAGTDPAAFLKNLEELGFELFLLARGGRLTRIEEHSAVIQAYSGRRYTNIVAVKGSGASLAGRLCRN